MISPPNIPLSSNSPLDSAVVHETPQVTIPSSLVPVDPPAQTIIESVAPPPPPKPSDDAISEKSSVFPPLLPGAEKDIVEVPSQSSPRLDQSVMEAQEKPGDKISVPPTPEPEPAPATSYPDIKIDLFDINELLSMSPRRPKNEKMKNEENISSPMGEEKPTGQTTLAEEINQENGKQGLEQSLVALGLSDDSVDDSMSLLRDLDAVLTRIDEPISPSTSSPLLHTDFGGLGVEPKEASSPLLSTAVVEPDEDFEKLFQEEQEKRVREMQQRREEELRAILAKVDVLAEKTLEDNDVIDDPLSSLQLADEESPPSPPRRTSNAAPPRPSSEPPLLAPSIKSQSPEQIVSSSPVQYVYASIVPLLRSLTQLL